MEPKVEPAMNRDAFHMEVDPETGFHTIGHGALGGKARGLALAAKLFGGAGDLRTRYPQVEIRTPATLVIATDAFEAYLRTNGLDHPALGGQSDEEIAIRFLQGRLPGNMEAALGQFLQQARHPLAIRSSGMLEDLRYHAYAGLYRTYMLSNDQSDLQQRLDMLVEAVKLVWASALYEGPRAYAHRVGHRIAECAMAVVIQPVVGASQGRFYYPAISGVAQSRNYYPLGGLRAEDGLATIALGLGKQVVSGERALRFSPKYPRRPIQRGAVEEILDYAQRDFYAVELGAQVNRRVAGRDHLVKRQVGDALEEHPVRQLVSTYVPSEHRIRDTLRADGQRLLTFANVLKYDLFPLAAIIRDVLALGEKTLGAAEIEFAVNLAAEPSRKHQFYLVQMRSMAARQEGRKVLITSEEQQRALCYSQNAMGNEERRDIADIVFIKPHAFAPERTREMVRPVAQINASLVRRRRQYVLVGPGRWGSADPWLGIPVRWADISNVATVVETTAENLNAELSQGAHFFHNLTSLGISYLCISRRPPDFIDWTWLTAQERALENDFAAHVQLSRPVAIKVDGRSSCGVILVEF
jgi:Pyruvate phosphate dikinase, AMP/ATP-binding domain